MQFVQTKDARALFVQTMFMQTKLLTHKADVSMCKAHEYLLMVSGMLNLSGAVATFIAV